MKAFGYLRLSKETEETTSPQRQRAKIEALCAGRGWDLVEIFEDIDQSAFNGHHRPEFERMVQRLDETDAIVFWRPDRLARSVADFSKLLDLCQQKDVALVSTDYPIDTSSAMGKAFVQITAVFAELEAGTISERSRQMHAYKRERGEWAGRPPFGWDVVGKHLERNEEQQAVLLDVARRYIDGESLNSIGKSHGMLATVLARILYSDRVHEALPDDLSGPLAEAIVARRYHQTSPARQTLLGGIAQCAMCGGRMSMSSSRGQRKGRWYTLRCRETGHVTIAGPWLERYVTEQVLETLDVGKLQEAIKRKRKTPRGRKASEIEARLELLDEQFTEGKVSKARFDRMNGQLLAQLKEAQTAERQKGIDLPAELARNLPERWDGMEMQTRRRIIQAVIERLEVSKAQGHGPIDPDRVRITWRS